MIKKVLLTLGIIGLGFINFSYGGRIILYPNETQVKDSVSITCDEKFNCFSSFNDITINGLNYGIYRDRLPIVFWNNNNLYFIYQQGGLWQRQKTGEFKTATYENVLNFTDNDVIDYLDLNGTITLENWINDYSDKQIISYRINGEGGTATICANYGSGINSVCFMTYGSISDRVGWVETDLGLSYPLSNDSILGIDYGLSPFNGGGSSNTPISGTGQYIELTGNLVYSDEKCTYGEIINYLQGAGYNKYLCFGGLDNFDTFDSTLNYSPIPGTGKTLGQILANASSTWNTPFEWFSFWNGLYQDRNNYISMWESYPAVYRTWFDLYYQYGGPDLYFETVNEYCTIISLVSDYTDFYNGNLFRSACQNYIIPYRNKTGDNAVSLNWGGIFGSGDSAELQNGKTFISEFFTQIKNNITVPDKSDFGLGILPSYIIWALLGLILFRFLSH